MSVENVKKFYEAVSKDELMKQKFVELSQKYHYSRFASFHCELNIDVLSL